MQMSAILLKAKPKVLGTEISTAFLISLKLTLKENRGESPHQRDAINWIKKWKNAPRATPIPRPVITKIGYKNIIPIIIPKLYKIGLNE